MLANIPAEREDRVQVHLENLLPVLIWEVLGWCSVFICNGLVWPHLHTLQSYACSECSPPLNAAAVDENVNSLAHATFGLGRDDLLDNSTDRILVCKVADNNLRLPAHSSDGITSFCVAFISLQAGVSAENTVVNPESASASARLPRGTWWTHLN